MELETRMGIKQCMFCKSMKNISEDEICKRCRDEIKYKVKNHICFKCGKKMKKGIDSITKKKSGYIWICECSPKTALLFA